jgi:hypothetical protein
MEPEELTKTTEEAHHKGEKVIGLTTALTAVLLAVVTLLGHRAHTEEIKLQTKVNDGWAFYQAKHSRSYEFALHGEDAVRAGATEMALRDLSIALEEECGVPAEKNCAIPLLKKSPVLQKFVKENAAGQGAGHSNASEGSATAHDGAAKQEKNPKESARKDGAVDLQEQTRDLEKETALIELRADHYDAAELFLQISIVLCAIALLAEAKIYWGLSFITTAIGVGIALFGWFVH